MELDALKELFKNFQSQVIFNQDLKEKIGLILEEKLKFF